jgi:hypothetical protein
MGCDRYHYVSEKEGIIMGKRNLAVTAAAVCSGLLMTLSAGVGRSAEEASTDRLRPGYIPDPQGYWQGDPFAFQG